MPTPIAAARRAGCAKAGKAPTRPKGRAAIVAIEHGAGEPVDARHAAATGGDPVSEQDIGDEQRAVREGEEHSRATRPRSAHRSARRRRRRRAPGQAGCAPSAHRRPRRRSDRETRSRPRSRAAAGRWPRRTACSWQRARCRAPPRSPDRGAAAAARDRQGRRHRAKTRPALAMRSQATPGGPAARRAARRRRDRDSGTRR